MSVPAAGVAWPNGQPLADRPSDAAHTPTTPVVGSGMASNGLAPSASAAGPPGSDAKAEKLARMKKLLAAADKRLAQAQADLQERDTRIQRLEAQLRR